MKKIIYILCFLQLAISCKQQTGNEKISTPAKFNSETIIKNVLNPAELISIADIALIVNKNTADITETVEDFGDNKSENNLFYSWPTGDSITRSVNTGVNIPQYSSVGFGHVFIATEDAFKLRYGPQTKEMVESRVKKIIEDTTLTTDIAIWEARDIAANAKVRQVEELSGVGNAAYWETPRNAMHILINDVSFSITANVSVEEATNKQMALKMLQVILNK